LVAVLFGSTWAVSVMEEAVTETKHNFDRPLADDAGNIHAAMCSRCGKTTELDEGDLPQVIKNEESEGCFCYPRHTVSLCSRRSDRHSTQNVFNARTRLIATFVI